ncbi:hypothetical protein GCM10027598_78040 [Amycolatopsis oliviviridis]|uniref:Uncharacterized protein n=1 Tax=Amycolatopsis oliviviridis TaxID=1471590 RepID=A0ABQ3L627_9PSEU|nr:hypothetical protein GCM10017790_07980 [Amycolatopsis oliviviridis]
MDRGLPDDFTVDNAVALAVRAPSVPVYRTELAAWSGRHTAPDGIPSANAPAWDDTPGVLPTRAFADPALGQPPGSALSEPLTERDLQ